MWEPIGLDRVLPNDKSIDDSFVRCSHSAHSNSHLSAAAEPAHTINSSFNSTAAADRTEENIDIKKKKVVCRRRPSTSIPTIEPY
jgi:hypothetical protein